MHYILYIHSSVAEHLGCFHVLAIMDNASMNIHIQVFVQKFFSILLGLYLGGELLSHMSTIKVFVVMSNCIPKWLHHWTFS